MANGHLKCVGSSYFLKKEFGCGYHLICVKKSTCDSEKVTALLRRYIPDIKVEGDVGTELSYQMPVESSKNFTELFRELEDNSDYLGVESYGISLTTLEDVFMKVGTDPVKLNEEPLQINGNLADQQDSEFGSDMTCNCKLFNCMLESLVQRFLHHREDKNS